MHADTVFMCVEAMFMYVDHAILFLEAFICKSFDHSTILHNDIYFISSFRYGDSSFKMLKCVTLW